MQAYAVASKLSINNMIEFCTQEMEGYKDVDVNAFPQYRQVIVCTEVFDPYRNSWFSISFPSSAPINKHYIAESIAEIESFGPANAQTLEIRPNTEIQKIIQKLTKMSEPMQIHQIFSASQFTAIPQKVRKVILDWSLELESKGILGENLEFSDVEQRKAQNMSITNNFYAPINGANLVATATNSTLNVNNTNSFDYEGVEKLLESVQKILPAGNFAKDDLDKIQKNIDEINESISKHDVPAVKGKLKDLADFCKGIAGNVIASGVWVQIQSLLQ